MPNMKNLGLIGAGAAGAVALTFGAAGIAAAQDDEPTLNDPATGTVDDNTDADRPTREERQQERIDRLIEDGVITQEQADDLASIREAIQADREANRTERQQAIADVLGITVEDLEAAREAGTPLAELAGDNLDDLVAYFTEQATERINEAVAHDKITQEQADERLDGLDERIQSRIENGGFGGHGERGMGKGRIGHGHGPRGGDNAPAEAQEASLT